MKINIESKDELVHDVIRKFDERSKVGFDKYHTTLRNDNDTLFRWLNDIQEELMDAILYLQKAKEEHTEARQEKYIEEYNCDDCDCMDVCEDLEKEKVLGHYYTRTSTGRLSPNLSDYS